MPPFVLERFEAVYAEPIAGFTLQHRYDPSITATDDTVVFAMTIHAADGGKAGELSRTFRRPEPDRAFARLSGIRLEREHQGHGFARALHEHEARELAALGICELSMEAAWQGAALWPELGFEPLERDSDAIAAVMDQSRYVIDPQTGEWRKSGRGDLLLVDLVAEHRITSDDADTLERMARDPQVPFAEIAGFGRDRTWRADDGRELWPGRALLAGARYEAVKPLGG